MYLEHNHFWQQYRQPQTTEIKVDTLHEQGSGELNEDVLIAAGQLFGVFDGATSLDRRRFAGGRTGGRLAADLAAKAFLEGGGSLQARAEYANHRIRQAQNANGIGADDRHLFWSTSLAVVRLDSDRFDYCQTGDAHILVISDDDSFRLLTPEVDIDSETLSIWKSANPPAAGTIHTELAAQIQNVRLQMNRTYGVLNGEPEAMQFLRHGVIELDGVRGILIFTDGLFLPREEPSAEHDWQGLVDLYLDGGLQAIRNRVKALQDADPGCRMFPRFKCHDDIAAVAIRLESALQPANALT